MKRLAAFIVMASLALAGCGGDSSAPVDHSAPLGAWGGGAADKPGSLASLSLTATGGHFDFYCGQNADLSQPLQTDSAGRFDVTGTATLGFAAPSPQPTHFVGTVTNQVMTVTLQVTPIVGTPYTSGPYTVTFGQTAPAFQGTCPG